MSTTPSTSLAAEDTPDHRPSLVHATDSRHRNVLIVALAGFGAESEEFFAPVADALIARGEVLYVNYGPTFDPQTIVTDTVTKINHMGPYQRIILVGVSMGGKLAWEIYRQLDPATRRLLFVDTPFDKHDLPLVARILAIANAALPRWTPFDHFATTMAFPGPKLHEMAQLTDQQRTDIATSVTSTRARESVRRMAAQTRYLKAHNMVMQPGDRPHVMTTAFITSRRGTDVVKNSSYTSWCDFLCHPAVPRMHHYTVDAKHAAFNVQPERYKQVVGAALTALIDSK